MENQFLPLVIMYPFEYHVQHRTEIETLEITNEDDEKIEIGKVVNSKYYPDTVDDMVELRLNSLPEYKLFVDLMHTDVLEDVDLEDHFILEDTPVDNIGFGGYRPNSDEVDEVDVTIYYTLHCDEVFVELIKDKLEEFKVDNDKYKEYCKEYVVEMSNVLKGLVSGIEGLQSEMNSAKDKLRKGLDKLCVYADKM